MQEIKEIVELAIKVIDETEHDVFINLFGHIKSIDIFVDKGGWQRRKPYDYKETVEWSEENYKEKTEEVKEYLLSLLEEE